MIEATSFLFFSILRNQVKTLLQQADYVFDDKALFDAFNECIERAGNHESNIKTALVENIKTRLANPGEDLDFSGRDDAFIVDESNADDILDEIFDAAGLRGALIKIGLERGKIRVPCVFFSDDFTVGDVDMAGEQDALCCISISNSKDIEEAINSVAYADRSFDFWNDILMPLGIDDEVEDKLDAAGIDSDNYDHAGGDKNGGVCYYDRYYRKHDE